MWESNHPDSSYCYWTLHRTPLRRKDWTRLIYWHENDSLSVDEYESEGLQTLPLNWTAS